MSCCHGFVLQNRNFSYCIDRPRRHCSRSNVALHRGLQLCNVILQRHFAVVLAIICNKLPKVRMFSRKATHKLYAQPKCGAFWRSQWHFFGSVLLVENCSCIPELTVLYNAHRPSETLLSRHFALHNIIVVLCTREPRREDNSCFSVHHVHTRAAHQIGLRHTRSAYSFINATPPPTPDNVLVYAFRNASPHQTHHIIMSNTPTVWWRQGCSCTP